MNSTIDLGITISTYDISNIGDKVLYLGCTNRSQEPFKQQLIDPSESVNDLFYQVTCLIFPKSWNRQITTQSRALFGHLIYKLSTNLIGNLINRAAVALLQTSIFAAQPPSSVGNSTVEVENVDQELKEIHSSLK